MSFRSSHPNQDIPRLVASCNKVQITKLMIDSKPILQQSALLLGKWLESNSAHCIKNLKVLYLCRNQLDTVGLMAVLDGVQSNRHLEHLHIMWNPLSGSPSDFTSNDTNDSRVLQSMCRLLEFNNTLHGLHLWGNELDCRQISLVASRGIQCNKGLTSLALPRNNIGPQGAAVLLESLKHNATLKELDLSWNQLGPKSARVLKEGLLNAAHLEIVLLDGNALGNKGAAAVASAIQENPSNLKQVSLSHNDVSVLGSKALAKGLERNTHVIKMNLTGNEIGNEGIQAFLDTLECKNKTLKTLGVDLQYQSVILKHYMSLNAAGRRNILSKKSALPWSLWSRVLARLSSKPAVLYYFLKETPELFDSKNSVSST